MSLLRRIESARPASDGPLPPLPVPASPGGSGGAPSVQLPPAGAAGSRMLSHVPTR